VRLFVAVNLPEEVRRLAHEAAAPLRAAGWPVRWVPAASLHLTLKFLGEVAAEREQPVAAALDASVASARPFDIGLGGVGAFPGLGRPRVIWMGVEAHPALELLANDVQRALAPFGFEAELRPFQPHFSLGRVRQGAQPGAFATLGRLAGEVVWEGVAPVESVDLMASVLGPGGAAYEVRHRSFLEGGR
jgi:RNA 2',3'-cyclic 3'-phosphodiesterase